MPKINILQVLQLQDKKKWKYLTLQENLTRCYTMNLFVDAILVVQDKIFRAHKSILSFHSPILRKAFYSKEVPATTCTIKEIKPEGFEILLRYLYTSEISNEVGSDALMEACYAAQVLQMVEIGEKLIHHILYRPRHLDKYSGKTIAQLQFWPLLEKCRSLRLERLQEELLKFAESNFTTILENEGFVAADIKTIKLVFDKKFPSVSQRYIMESIARWVEANDHLVFLDQYVTELLKCVDFKRLSPKEFYAVASRYDCLLSKKDSLDILMHLFDPTVCLLPQCQSNEKELNIPVNQETKSKTPGQMQNNLSSPASDWRKKDFKSQEDLRKTTNVQNVRMQNNSVGFNTLQESFCQMLEEGLFTDVTLIAKDNTEIPAHRLVLALGSEFFTRIFYEAIPATKTLRMEETAEEVKDMLRYFYGNGKKSIYGSSLDSILRKTDMALKYLCYPLKQVCDNALRITLTPENFWTLNNWMVRVSHSKVSTEALMSYAVTSTKQIFENHSFLKASKDSLVSVLKSDYLNIAERDILEHVARWMEENVKQLPSDNSRKELLENIRFEGLEAEQFFSFMRKHEGLLPIQDLFAILEFLFRRCEGGRLPTWCYRGALRSVFYDPSAKIGTNITIPWSDSLGKDKNSFTCNYMISIRDKQPKSEIQFLELSLKIKPPDVGRCSLDCTCSVTITADDGKGPLTFQDLNMFLQHRYLLPVSFSLDASYNKSMKLVVTVDAKHPHDFYYVTRQALEFDNAVFIATDKNNNCLCDAIVDGFTSENVPIPPHLLRKNRKEAVATRNFFKVTLDPKA